MMHAIRLLTAGFMISCAAGAAQAAVIPGSFTANYFTVLSNPDFNQGFHSTLQADATLGSNGLPMLRSSSRPIHSLTADDEITWWSPALNSDVRPSTTAPTLINYLLFYSPMYAPAAGASGGPSPVPGLGFLTAHFSGAIDGGMTEYLHLGSDDDAFVYIDGTLVSAVGGVHEFTRAPIVQLNLASGSHTLDIFYADREQTQARLFFALTDTPEALNIPEPASLAAVAVALAGMALTRRRTR